MAFIQVKIQIQAPKRIIWEYIMKHTHHKKKFKKNNNYQITWDTLINKIKNYNMYNL